MLKVVGNESAQDEVDGRCLLAEIAREGARRMLVAALEAEVAAYLEAHRAERGDEGQAGGAFVDGVRQASKRGKPGARAA